MASSSAASSAKSWPISPSTAARATTSRCSGCRALVLHPHRRSLILRSHMSDKADVWQGTLALMVLKTLETLGPLHGYGIARRIEHTSAHHLAVNYGTLYP